MSTDTNTEKVEFLGGPLDGQMVRLQVLTPVLIMDCPVYMADGSFVQMSRHQYGFHKLESTKSYYTYVGQVE